MIGNSKFSVDPHFAFSTKIFLMPWYVHHVSFIGCFIQSETGDRINKQRASVLHTLNYRNKSVNRDKVDLGLNPLVIFH